MRHKAVQSNIRRAGIAVACGVLLCAVAQAQEPVHPPAQTQATAPTQVAAVASAKPATGGARRPTNVEPGSPEAKLFSAIDAPIVKPQPGDETPGKSSDGSTKIHGHWVIELKAKDGSIKDRREFENSYVAGANMGLYLAGFQVSVDPAVFVYSATNTSSSLCNGLENISGSTNNSCGIFSSLSAGHGALDTASGYCAVAGSCYSGLTATLAPTGGPYTSLVLAATITPVTTGTFDTVQTTFTSCYDSGYNAPATISPNACYANAVSIFNTSGSPYIYNQPLTATTFAGGPVTVTAGETLVFTVTISFS